MAPTQIPNNDLNRFFRCEELGEVADRGKSPGQIQKTDMGIKVSILNALWNDEILRTLDNYAIDVHVKNGVVYLNGHVVSTTSQSRIKNAIRAIPGILGIKNNLVLDDKLTLEVAASLGLLEHTYECKFFTGASHGVVSLGGIVNDDNVKLLAEKCAAGNPNVRGVINHVRVSGAGPGLPGQPFLQPTIGEIIYFLDGLSGVVKQVIINPNNRLVIAMTIQVKFTALRSKLKSITDKAQLAERTITVPMNAVRYLTKSSGFLTIKSTETTRVRDFNPLYFTAPKMDWMPPYPYCPADVLFNVDAQEIENQIMVDPDIEQLKASTQPTSPLESTIPVDVLAEWENDGGKIIQTTEAGT
jgi:osmotically-inducible protein OsmY